MNLMLFWAIVFAGLSPANTRVVCEGASHSVEYRSIYQEESLFTEKKLIEYFRPFSEYRPGRSLVMLVSADRDLTMITSIPGGSEKPPGIIPSSAPRAKFWKFGEHAFFEYRDRKGRIGWKTLRGQNIYSAVISGHRVVLVGESFRCTSPQRHVYHQLAFVVPDLPEMADEEIARICLFYRDVLAPESVEVSLWASFDGVAPGFPLPTLESLAGGYTGGNYSGIATRHARYSGFTGELLVSESSTTARRLKIP